MTAHAAARGAANDTFNRGESRAGRSRTALAPGPCHADRRFDYPEPGRRRGAAGIRCGDGSGAGVRSFRRSALLLSPATVGCATNGILGKHAVSSIYALKGRFQNLLRPSVRRLHARGVTANQVTLPAAGVSLLVALLVGLAAAWAPWLLM